LKPFPEGEIDGIFRKNFAMSLFYRKEEKSC